MKSSREKINETKVTVVIPAYNVEKYIGECISSLIHQTYKNIEIIIVDDGSSDGTIDIIDGFRKKDGRIRLIKQNHSGPNIARKRGVQEAKGEYVMFVDADDFLDTVAVETLVSYFEKEDVDSIKFGAKRFPKGVVLPSILGKDEKVKVFEKEEVIRSLLISGRLNNLFSQIYKTSFLKDISAFDSGLVFGEDLLVNFEVHQKMWKMLAINDILYFYRDNPSSTTNSMSRDRIVGNVIDRVYVSSVLIKYALSKKEFNNDISRIVFYQLSMVRDAMVGVMKIKGYSKKDFYDDLSKMDLKNKVNKLNINKDGLYAYILKLGFKERIKNEQIIRGIVKADYELLWKNVRRYRLYWRLKTIIHG